MVLPVLSQVQKSRAIITAADELDMVVTVMGEGRAVLVDMPHIDREQMRLMAEFDAALSAAIQAGKALDYRLEVFREKGII